MALRGTLTHRKTRRLAKALGIPVPCALGVLEALWHVTGEQAKDGGIGRMSNQDLADEMFWDECADSMVGALLESGWLDENPDTRLYVHDWHVHSDDATDNANARSGTKYANGALPRMKRLPEQERAKLCARWGWICSGEPQKATQSHGKPLPVPVPVPVPESGIPPKPPRTFVKPTQSECDDYAKTIGLPVPESRKLYDFYESKGWKVGRAAMKDWQAAMRNWQRNWKGESKSGDWLDGIGEAS